MDRNALRGKVQTVLGPIAPETLGATLMHEHIFIDLVSPKRSARNEPETEITLETVFAINYGRVKNNNKFRLESVVVGISEVSAMKAAGGQAMVDLTCGGIKPNPEGLVEVAKATGVHIVMGCGYYVEEFQSSAAFKKTVDQLAEEIIGQVLEGAWGTSVRAGIIGEIGCQAPWTDLEKRVMRGAVTAQKETGAAINAHPGRHPDQPQEIAEFVRKAGGDVSRLVISHIDRTIFDVDRLLKLADTGATIEFDLFGIEQTFYPLSDIDMPNDGVRLKLIRALIDRGHLGQVVISHDICTKTRQIQWGGHGYGHIFQNVLPLMRARGFSEAEIDAILVANPRRILTIQ